jgi:signal transduction histidine kinase/predicted hydrocarbon binding protein
MANNHSEPAIIQKSPGILHFGAARMALLEIEAGFWSIRKQIEALIGTPLTNSVLQQAGANGGAAFAASFGQTGTGQDSHQFFEACLNAYQAAGFGKFSIEEECWPIGRLIIHAEDAFEAWMMRKHGTQSGAPVCAYTAGVLVGFINIIDARRDIVCVERACQALGDEQCLFELMPVSESSDATVVAMTHTPTIGRQINLLEMLFERMPMGIAVIDRDMKLVRCNPTWAAFIERYTPSKANKVLPGAYLFDLEPGTEDILVPLFERVFAGETIRQNAVRIESGGIESYWDIVLSPLHEDGKIIGLLNVSTDATERIQVYQTLEERVQTRTLEIERRQDVAESLRDILHMLNSDRPSQEIFEFLAAQSARLLEGDASLLFSIQGEQARQEAGYNLPPAMLAFETSMLYPGPANQKLLKHEPVTISNASEYLGPFLSQPDLDENNRRWVEIVTQHYQAYFGIPLVIRQQLFGGLTIYYHENRTFSEEDLRLGMMLGEQATLAIENDRLRREEYNRRIESERLRQVAESLGDILSKINSAEPLEAVLEYIVQQADQLSESKFVALYVLNRAEQVLQVQALRGDFPKEIALVKLKIGEGTIGRALQERRIITIPDIDQISIAASPDAIDERNPVYVSQAHQDILSPHSRTFAAGLAAPLLTQNGAYGALAFYYPDPHTFQEDEIKLASAFASQAALAIENAQLFERAEQAAAAMERSRLARDLHDAVTQTLFSANLIADVLPRLWERNPQTGREKLDELRTLTRGALSEMRTLLLELRPGAFGDVELGDLYQHLANAFSGRTRIPVTFTQNGQAALPLPVKEAFYRIAQEALNNIAKHAQASQVQMHLDVQADYAQALILDNGLGFDPELLAPQNMGIKIMSERAEAIQASFEITNGNLQPGAFKTGTLVKVCWKPDGGMKQ